MDIKDMMSKEERDAATFITEAMINIFFKRYRPHDNGGRQKYKGKGTINIDK